MHRRPLGRGRKIAILGAIVVVAGCLVPWYAIGGEATGIPERSMTAFGGLGGLLVFLAALGVPALVSLPYASGDRPVSIDRWPVYLLLLGVIAGGLVATVGSILAGDLLLEGFRPDLSYAIPDAEALLQYCLTRDMKKLSVGQVVYSAMCYDHGGMIDDGTVFRLGQNNFRWIGGDDYGGQWLREQAEKKGYRAWGADITPNDTPFHAGLGWAVKTASGNKLGAVNRAMASACGASAPGSAAASMSF